MANVSRILVLDEGTTSTRAMLYSDKGALLAVAQEELTQYYPAPGMVEHDAAEIWDKTLKCARALIAEVGGAANIAAIGITNQRETVVAWDRTTGEPICRALVWQDRRTEEQCRSLREAGHEDTVQAKTGLVLDPYFSATKMRWIWDNVPEARAIGDRLAFGTIESWLTYKLTGGAHICDVTNASRTLLMPLDATDWDDGLCDLFGVPKSALPRIVPSCGAFGTALPDLLGAPIPITGMAGDQQSATLGQGCFAAGQTKATLGTGAFILTNMGTKVPRSDNRLLGTVLCEVGGTRSYALEGSVFAAGSLIKWMRDNLGLLGSAAESEHLARSVEDSAGVTIVPALAGLGAPYWRASAKGVISGLTFAATRAHIARAALESMAHIFYDLKEAFAADGAPWQELRLDGGMSANDWLAQDIANMLDIPCHRPEDIETTARGAAILAAIGAGLYRGFEDAQAMLPRGDKFAPQLDSEKRSARLGRWKIAVASAIAEE